MRALAAFAIAAEEGRLPAEARWILDSSLVYLKKKHGNKPRPVRIGEVLRRLVAKRHCARAAPAVRRALLAARQVGVAVPGVCEGLVHSQRALEELLSTGQYGAWAVVDLVLVNCFCHFEWAAVRDGVSAITPELNPW